MTARAIAVATLIAAVVALSLPALALGQASVSGYASPAGQAQTQLGATPQFSSKDDPAAAATPGHSDLPFTGLDLVPLVGIGLVLLAIGLALKRLVAHHTP